jgi:hypothetical protein
VKILTNCHNLLRNPWYWPICVLRKWIPHRVKVWRGCAHNIAFFPLRARAKFLFVVALFLSAAPFSAVVPDATDVELFFVARTASGSAEVRASARHCHRPLRSSSVYVETGKAYTACMKDTPHVPLRQIAEGKIRGKEL